MTAIGYCKYCGQSRMVVGGAGMDADALVSAKCDCPGATMARNRVHIARKIAAITQSDGQLWGETSIELAEAIKILAEACVEQEVASVSIALTDGTTIKLRAGKLRAHDMHPLPRIWRECKMSRELAIHDDDDGYGQLESAPNEDDKIAE